MARETKASARFIHLIFSGIVNEALLSHAHPECLNRKALGVVYRDVYNGTSIRCNFQEIRLNSNIHLGTLYLLTVS